MQTLDISKPIQVRTGDYRHKWMDTKVISVSADVKNDDEENTFVELSFGVVFEDGCSQQVTDAFGWSKNEWRYKDTKVV